MLAAVGGVLYTLATVLKLQGYSAYVQPMPVVVAAMRWGPAAGRKTMTATCFLLLGEPGQTLALTPRNLSMFPSCADGGLFGDARKDGHASPLYVKPLEHKSLLV